MPMVAGQRLGPYEVQALIGAGGMGKVYRARDTRLNRTVALKILPSDLATDPERRARFEREAQAIAALSHPHICTLHDIGEANGATYLDTRLDRTVALKILPPELAADPERHSRFEREAHAIAALTDPHICTLHDIGTRTGSECSPVTAQERP